MISLMALSRYSGLISFLVGLPTTVGTYYQVWRTRREAKEARQGLVYSENCLEFMTESGDFINLVPLETLHSLPKPSDVVLLPGGSTALQGQFSYRAYRVTRIEHIYANVQAKHMLPGQARLAKAVAHVEPLTGTQATEDFPKLG
jgi:hypothetical protein